MSEDTGQCYFIYLDVRSCRYDANAEKVFTFLRWNSIDVFKQLKINMFNLKNEGKIT